MPALNLFPSEAELQTFTSIDAVVQYVGLSRPIWAAISAHMGNLPHMRALAMMPSDLVHSAVTDLRIGLLDAYTGRPALDDDGNPATRALTMVESVQAFKLAMSFAFAGWRLVCLTLTSWTHLSIRALGLHHPFVIN